MIGRAGFPRPARPVVLNTIPGESRAHADLAHRSGSFFLAVARCVRRQVDDVGRLDPICARGVVPCASSGLVGWRGVSREDLSYVGRVGGHDDHVEAVTPLEAVGDAEVLAASGLRVRAPLDRTTAAQNRTARPMVSVRPYLRWRWRESNPRPSKRHRWSPFVVIERRSLTSIVATHYRWLMLVRVGYLWSYSGRKAGARCPAVAGARAPPIKPQPPKTRRPRTRCR